MDGSTDFDRNYAAYRNGFGDPEGNFWLGLEHLHILTNSANYRVDILVTIPGDNDLHLARYNTFVVGDSTGYYTLLSNSQQNVPSPYIRGRCVFFA